MICKALFHLLGALQFGYGCYYDYMYVYIPGSSPSSRFGGKLKYLTYLDAIIQTVYFSVAFINDLIGTNEPTPIHKPLIRKVKDRLFSSLAFPVSVFVASTFWGIYAIDRELILPTRLDPYFPSWLNHVMHTNIIIFTFIELVCTFRMYPSKKQGLTILVGFVLFYVIWIHFIFFKTGHWVYPILEALTWPVKIIFYVFLLAFICSLYSIGEKLNQFIWPNEVEYTVKSSKKKAK